MNQVNEELFRKPPAMDVGQYWALEWTRNWINHNYFTLTSPRTNLTWRRVQNLLFLLIVLSSGYNCSMSFQNFSSSTCAFQPVGPVL